jgi:nitric oxide reductase NorD protein
MVPANPLSSLGILASAIAGRSVAVQYAAANELPWTDGAAIFVQRDVSETATLRQLCVQGALLSAGSLEHAIVRSLARRRKPASRYLAVEGVRALRALGELLPPLMDAAIGDAGPIRSGSPAESLDIACSHGEIPDPPLYFGTIHVHELLTAHRRTRTAGAADSHLPRQHSQRPLIELPDEVSDDETEDIATSPVGGGGQLGRLLQKLFQTVRRLQGGGSPGADAPTRRSNTASRAGVPTPQTSMKPETVENAFGQYARFRYPEWDAHRGGYRSDWCTVQELDPPGGGHAAVSWLDGYSLRKPLSRLGMGLERLRRQAQGDDIDIDAAIEAELDLVSGQAPGESCYIESRQRRRDLSVLVLLDISGSTAQTAATGPSVHEQQRRAAATLVTVLHEVGDRVALYAFNSQGRSSVRLVPVKRFDEPLGSETMRRLYRLTPGAYSRLGAAVRHGTAVLLQRGGTPRKLLLLLSDGLAYDHGYEPAYGATDARHALAEARREGVGCLCLSIGSGTDSQVLKRVFGSAAHATLPGHEHLGRVVAPLFRAALRAAEVRRSSFALPGIGPSVWI